MSNKNNIKNIYNIHLIFIKINSKLKYFYFLIFFSILSFTITYIDFNILDYVCECKRKNRKKNQNIEIFNFGVNFYKNQMNIINIFNIIFLGQMLITNYLYKKNKNIFSQFIEIPIKT